MNEDRAHARRPGRVASIRYGKANVTLYRTYARPLSGLNPIPESAFTGRNNILFGADVDVEVFGDNFLPAYTRGDNSNVVATDTMKNFIHRTALEFDGATLEALLHFLGRRFLETYPEMQSLRMRGRELPFPPARVPEGSAGFGASAVLFGENRDDRSTATLHLERRDSGPIVVDHRCGREDLRLIKITGSAFASFLRDDYTTLPEVRDRPLFVYLDVFWQYADVADAVSPDPARYVAAEQVADCVRVVFHQFVSMSIQHLVHEMGQRLLERFPQLAEVTFEAQNRLWDTAVRSESNPKLVVYTDPRPPYGSIGLTLRRD
ncbi:MAG: urate oxidase [Chloroflexi bacterium]|nr:urate oxidase [Chloroflexota bacterium]